VVRSVGSGLGKFACALAVTMLALGGLTRATLAQDEKPRTLFEFLFRGGDRAESPRKAPPSSKSKSRSKSAKSTKPRVAAPEVEVVEKSPTAKVVLVIGDFMAGGLAEGLTEVYVQNPDVRVIERSKGSSGFARPDFHNWPEEIKTLIETEKPALVAVMIGSNDRQEMSIGELREPPMTDAWIKEYTARATALGTSIRQMGVPFVWVGMPSFKSKKMTSDMLVLNDVYRTAAQASGGEFIDIWEGFVDEAGAYVQTGPDINGQPVRLRSSDGINMTRPGKRKLAFYAEKPLAKFLGGAGGGVSGPTVPFLGSGTSTVDPLTIDRTVPVSLMDPELDGGGELLGAISPAARNNARTLAEKLVVEGIAPEAVPGRADDFSGRPAVADKPAEPDTTTAITANQ
jgi:uncharacterized protein